MAQCPSGELFSFLHFGIILIVVSDRWGSGSNSLQFIIPPITAITSFVGSSATLTSSLSNNLDDGVNAAKAKDVAFVFVNAYVSSRSETHGFDGFAIV
jgi:hypothetical protein